MGILARHTVAPRRNDRTTGQKKIRAPSTKRKDIRRTAILGCLRDPTWETFPRKQRDHGQITARSRCWLTLGVTVVGP